MGGIGLPLGEGFQNTPAAETEQIAQHAGELDGGLFKQRFDLGLKAHAVADQLLAHARGGAPTALLRRGHETENQLAGQEAAQQPAGIAEVVFAAARGAIGVGLRQVQPEVRLQRLPHRLPVLGGGFHHHFFHAARAEPGGEPI